MFVFLRPILDYHLYILSKLRVKEKLSGTFCPGVPLHQLTYLFFKGYACIQCNALFLSLKLLTNDTISISTNYILLSKSVQIVIIVVRQTSVFGQQIGLIFSSSGRVWVTPIARGVLTAVRGPGAHPVFAESQRVYAELRRERLTKVSRRRLFDSTYGPRDANTNGERILRRQRRNIAQTGHVVRPPRQSRYHCV